jgi:diguanylate cyclase (GGDEF)-like protein
VFRRKQTDAEPAAESRVHAEEPPRLVRRFALYAAIGFALAAVAVLLLVRHFATEQAERTATLRAQSVASSILAERVLATDFTEAIDEERRAELAEIFRRFVLNIDGTLIAELVARDGTIVYSSRPNRAGTTTERVGDVQPALSGAIVSVITNVETAAARSSEPGSGQEPATVTKSLTTFAPIPFIDQNDAAILAMYHDYKPISDAARAAFLPVAGVFEVALLLMCVGLIPALRRVTKRMQLQMAEIERRAYFDDLTGLPNRTLFHHSIEAALDEADDRNGRIAVLMMDLDRFKEINDTLGHHLGDALLQELAIRVARVLPEGDTLARLGGDEFALLLTDAHEAQALETVAQIQEQLLQPFVLGELLISVEASVGIAIAPEHGRDQATLLQHADVAMYVAKGTGAGSSIYDPEKDTNDARQLALVGELRSAIEQDELTLCFQPKVNVETRTISGVEALVRWNHPEQGLLMPDVFVPLAERTGLIRPLGRYVLERAIEQCARWREANLDLHVAVNLTMPDLLDLDLPPYVDELLQRHNVPASTLELEITEGTISADPVRVFQVVTGLGEMGVRLAIDDFGTGYSSLAYLKDLPVDALKIDKSFVMNMENDLSDATIVRSTIDLGRNLGLDIVAEGVESDAAWEALRAFGRTYAQGYFISKPIPVAELEEMMANGPWARNSLDAPSHEEIASLERAIVSA